MMVFILLLAGALTVNVKSGVVHIHGTADDDDIRVQIRQVVVPREGDRAAYTKFVYDIGTPATTGTFDVQHTLDVGAGAKSFVVYGGGGNDTVNLSQVNERVTPGVRCSVMGNDGDDFIIGANAPTRIIGGPGNDTAISLHDGDRPSAETVQEFR